MGVLSRTAQTALKVASSAPGLKHREAEPSTTSTYELDGDVFYDAPEVALHEHAHNLGGLACPNPGLQARQQKAVAEWIATLGKRLLTGNSLSHTPAPVAIFEARSYLQKLVDGWQYTQFLEKAARDMTPMSRMKLVVAWYIAGLRHSFCWQKPFNPLLGETWRGRSRSGCKVSCKQVSHHPPVSEFLLEGPGYTLRGASEPMVSVAVTHRGFKQVVKGPCKLTFDDGAEVNFVKAPGLLTKCVVGSSDMRGDVVGQLILTLTVPGEQTLSAVVNFGPLPSQGGVYARTDAFSGYVTAGAEELDLDGRSSSDDDNSVGGRSGAGVSAPLAGSDQSSSGSLSSAFASSGNLWRRSPYRGTEKLQSASGTDRPQGILSAWLRSANGATERDVPKDALMSLQGSWLSHLDCTDSKGTERLWTLQEAVSDSFVDAIEHEQLATDSSRREDLQLLAAGDLRGAEVAKLRLEEEQRRRLRLQR